MILAIDIGNTNISFGVFGSKGRLVKKYHIATSQKARYGPLLKNIFARFKINDALVCSVVPLATKVLAKELKIALQKKPVLIGRDLMVPVKNKYRKPFQVGQDRLVNAYAAFSLYGSPAVIIDFGTAVTFDVVSRKKEYRGGMILPGLAISLDALARRTALLPRIKLQKPKEFIGKDTRSSMLSGIVYGFAALTDDLVQRIILKIGPDAKIIATGGDAVLLGKFCKSLQSIDLNLTLKGIYLLHRNL